MHRRYETRAERIAWLNDDGNQGRYDIAMKQRPKNEYLEQAKKRHKERVSRLKDETKLNEP